MLNREFFEIIRKRKRGLVLLTIVSKRGSSFRKLGSYGLYLSKKKAVGPFVVGCLEEDFWEAADGTRETPVPVLVPINMESTYDTYFGTASGCPGEIEILFEPFQLPIKEIFVALEKGLKEGKMGIIGAVLSGPDVYFPRTKFLVLEDKTVIGEMPNVMSVEEVLKIKTPKILRKKKFRIFLNPIFPAPKILIIGKGFMVTEVLKLLNNLYFDLYQGFYGKVEPSKDGIGYVNLNEISKLKLDRNTYILSLTHNYFMDKRILQTFLPTPVPYIGILSSKKRIRKILNEIDKKIVEENGHKIHSPVGTKIGAQTPEEIAVSIVAELISLNRKRK